MSPITNKNAGRVIAFFHTRQLGFVWMIAVIIGALLISANASMKPQRLILPVLLMITYGVYVCNRSSGLFANTSQASHAAALRCDGASHCGATRDWVGRGVCGRIQQRRREKGQVSMELAVGARLASLGSLAAMEKCSRLSGQRLSELKTYNSGSKRGRLVYTDRVGRTDNGNPGLNRGATMY
jgi:hypothetical protein